MLHILLRAIALITLISTLSGCGQKGPLYLPQPADSNPEENKPASS